jgi:hypothetical protein
MMLVALGLVWYYDSRFTLIQRWMFRLNLVSHEHLSHRLLSKLKYQSGLQAMHYLPLKNYLPEGHCLALGYLSPLLISS